MRLNKYIASSSPLSRRAADAAIAAGRITVNGKPAEQGVDIGPHDHVALDGIAITPSATHTTAILNKPVGYVCSRNGQGARTIYDLLPPGLQHLQPVGRLDKHSSGLLLLTDDGDLANQLTHPRYGKTKVYEVILNKPLQPLHHQMISDIGVQLEDGRSQFAISQLERGNTEYQVTMREGRNRQIRRTFAALGYTVIALHRTHFGPYSLGDTPAGHTQTIATK